MGTTERPGPGLGLGLACGLLLAFASPSAWAHSGQLKRVLLFEPAKDHLEVLIEVVVTGPKRQAALLSLVDADRNGRLDAREQQHLETELAVFGMDGLHLRAGTATVSLEGAETKAQVEPGRPIVALLHGTIPLPPAGRLVLTTDRGAAPLTVRLLPGRPPLTFVRPGRPREVVLGPQDRLELALLSDRGAE